MKKLITLAAFAAILLTGCTTDISTIKSTPQKVAEMKTHDFGVITLELPIDCFADGAAGSQYIMCPTEKGGEPESHMVISTDGQTVRISKGVAATDEFYTAAVASLKTQALDDREVTIVIE